jgi:DNA-binding response OmpR family regulator
MAPVTVLVVDDDPVILKLLEVNFEMEGFRVLTAVDGGEGLRLARTKRPDIVISDVMMPKVDGLELATALKGDPKTADLPVILLSARAQSADVQRGLDVGVDEYVTKPFDPLELVDLVLSVLDRVKR